MKQTTYLKIFKQNFKFSSAHFLIFDETRAEMLHGHNYQVEVELYPKSTLQFDELGYFIDFFEVKKVIKSLCDVWDEHILLPRNHPDMKFKLSDDSKNYEIHFRDRYYSLPVNETIWLPITNTSVEQLSKIFASQLLAEFGCKEVELGGALAGGASADRSSSGKPDTQNVGAGQIGKVSVSIEETRGQSATTTIDLEAH